MLLSEPCGIDEGFYASPAGSTRAREHGARETRMLHAVAEEDEGLGADDEAQLLALIQDSLGGFDARGG